MRIDGIGGGYLAEPAGSNGAWTRENEVQSKTGVVPPWLGASSRGVPDTSMPKPISPEVGGMFGGGTGFGQLMDLLEKLLHLLTNVLRQQGGNTTSGVGGGTATRATNVENGSPVDGPEGFLFKPVSESNGNLVVLLPREMTGDVQSVTLKDQNGNVIEEGDFASTANGGREHFRFGEAGGNYPANITVEVQMKDGSVKTYDIADPSKRYD